nr:MAG TPA: hypothetical protein [Caudoviricetes sp.]
MPDFSSNLSLFKIAFLLGRNRQKGTFLRQNYIVLYTLLHTISYHIGITSSLVVRRKGNF